MSWPGLFPLLARTIALPFFAIFLVFAFALQAILFVADIIFSGCDYWSKTLADNKTKK